VTIGNVFFITVTGDTLKHVFGKKKNGDYNQRDYRFGSTAFLGIEGMCRNTI
jgi:hypothetical protein